MANNGAVALPTSLADAHNQVLLHQNSAQFALDQSQLKSMAKRDQRTKPRDRAAYAVGEYLELLII